MTEPPEDNSKGFYLINTLIERLVLKHAVFYWKI